MISILAILLIATGALHVWGVPLSVSFQPQSIPDYVIGWSVGTYRRVRDLLCEDAYQKSLLTIMWWLIHVDASSEYIVIASSVLITSIVVESGFREESSALLLA